MRSTARSWSTRRSDRTGARPTITTRTRSIAWSAAFTPGSTSAALGSC